MILGTVQVAPPTAQRLFQVSCWTFQLVSAITSDLIDTV
jgi:hypothetical protein